MNTQKKPRTVAQSKAAISQKCKSFEARMLKSRNALDQVQIMNEMEEALESEIYAWDILIQNEKDSPGEGSENVINNAVVFIADLQSIIDKICEGRKELLPAALILLKANKNSGNDLGIIKHLNDE